MRRRLRNLRKRLACVVEGHIWRSEVEGDERWYAYDTCVRCGKLAPWDIRRHEF